MSKTTKLQELTQSEKIILAEELWDSVAADESLFPLTNDQKAELVSRLASYTVSANDGDTWENVRNRISNP